MIAPVPAWLYVLRLASGELYMGVTYGLERRWIDPVPRGTAMDVGCGAIEGTVLLTEGHASYAAALARERELRRP